MNQAEKIAAIKSAVAEFASNRDAMSSADVPPGLEELVRSAMMQAFTQKLIKIFGGNTQ